MKARVSMLPKSCASKRRRTIRRARPPSPRPSARSWRFTPWSFIRFSTPPAADAQGEAFVNGPFTAKPKISTGAGDHFNAGFVIGRLLGLGVAPLAATRGRGFGLLRPSRRQPKSRAARPVPADAVRFGRLAGGPVVFLRLPRKASFPPKRSWARACLSIARRGSRHFRE